MKWINNLKINQKILGAIMFSSLFLASIFGWIIWDSLTNMMTEDLAKRGVNIAKNVAETSSDYILFDDQYAVDNLIKETKKVDEEIRYILVFDSRRTLYAHTFPNPEILPKGIVKAHTPKGVTQKEDATLSSDEGNIHDVIVPIEEGEVGYVRVGMSEEKSLEYIYSRIVKLLIVTLLISIGAMGMAYFATRMITKPINTLVDVALGISAGNLSLRAEGTNNDEIGKLAQAFNEMTDHLINSNNEVDYLLKELQQKDLLRDKLISKLLSVQEDERKRISRELHDETSQALTSLMVTMRIMANEAKDGEQRELLYTSRDIAAGILKQIRDLAVELRPPILDKMGLVSAIKKYARNFEGKYKIQVHLFVPDDDVTIAEHVTLALYRIVQESMSNVVKHTNATEIMIGLDINKRWIYLTINDNGQGIHEADFEKAKQQNRIGIHGMKERAELQGGTFFIRTNKMGGTEISVSLPLN
ncbi:ATP-binding protein [Peribacillus sp. NPDC097198]|uniref:HAMP domain-containing sensor histidine kinase n=1 Tax=Peribacillus sp. NPDC097198 TaxID=3364397 RepID=UPI00381471E2